MKKGIIILGILLALTLVISILYFNKDKKTNPAILSSISQITDDDIVIGDYNASTSMIMYYDYNCKYCKKFFTDLYPDLYKNYIQTGKVKLVLRLICKANDRLATEAYQTVVCINKFGNFEKLHKLLLHKSEIIYSEYFQELKDEYIATNSNVGECIINSENQAIIRNIHQFQTLETKGTPTFIIGKDIVVGLKDMEYFKQQF